MDQHFDGGWDARELQLELEQHQLEQQQQQRQHDQAQLRHHDEQQSQQERYSDEGQQQPQMSGSPSPQPPPYIEAVPGKPQTTKRARAAGEARRKNDPRFICPVENCGATFTRSVLASWSGVAVRLTAPSPIAHQ